MGVGQHALQRAEAFARLPGFTVVQSPMPTQPPANILLSIAKSVAWRLHRPLDLAGENAALLAAARSARPDVLFCDNARNIRPATLAAIKEETGAHLVFSSPDDIVAPHNGSKWLADSYAQWDLFFTTKTFNIAELRAAGVRRVALASNMYNPAIHRPMTPAEVGADYEAFDIVFVGTHERAREDDLRALAEAGFSVLVCGNAARRFGAGWRALEKYGVVVRPAVIDEDYTRTMHFGRVAMCFLRKLNRDRITQRSIEIPAMRRPMLAEHTDEHDAHFVEGVEYVGFSTRAEMVDAVRGLIGDPDRRAAIAAAGYARCLASGYDIDAVTRTMAARIAESRAAA